MMHQLLESRVHLSATYGNRVLVVTGSPANDVIAITVKNDKVALFENGVQTASFHTVRSIVVDALGGRDRVVIDPTVSVKTTLNGGDQPDTLIGGSGPDIIRGGGGSDRLFGSGDIDALLGDGGDDTLRGGAGDDYLDGGAGADAITYDDVANPVSVELIGQVDATDAVFISGRAEERRMKNGLLYGIEQTDTLANVEQAVGGTGNDELVFRTRVVDVDSEYPSAIRFYGGAGNDGLFFDKDVAGHTPFGQVESYGGTGNDQLGDLNFSGMAAFGEDGDDLFSSAFRGTKASTYDGGPGRDQINVNTSTSIDRLPAGIEDAIVYPEFDKGVFYGNELDNTITVLPADASVVTVYGGDGNDRLISDSVNHGTVRLYGEAGNDVLIGGGKRSTHDGQLPDSFYDIPDYLDGGAGDDALFGHGGNDTLFGGDGNDYMEGMDGDDSLVGGIGNDTIRGGNGVDRFEGEAGNDLFYSRGADKDYLYGGPGTDSAQRDDAEQILNSVENRLA